MKCKPYNYGRLSDKDTHYVHQLTKTRNITVEVRALIVGPEFSIRKMETPLVTDPMVRRIPNIKYSAHGDSYFIVQRLLILSNPSMARESFRYPGSDAIR